MELTFNLMGGEKAVLKPDGDVGDTGARGVGAEVEMLTSGGPGYVVEPLNGERTAWEVRAESACRVTVVYRATFPADRLPQSAPEAARGTITAASIMRRDLRIFRAGDALLCPLDEKEGSCIGGGYSVTVEVPHGEKVLTPWKSAGGSTFTVSGAEHLADNYIALGGFRTVGVPGGKSTVTVGFSENDYAECDDAGLESYAGRISALLEQTDGLLGERPGLKRLSVVVCGAGRFGLEAPAVGTLRDSIVLFHGGEVLKGPPAAAASRAVFELWNRWSFKPAVKGGALWFQEGLPWVYCYRIPVLAGMLDPDVANREFSRVYTDYVTNPLARRKPLSEITGPGTHQEAGLLASKGAVVCASAAQRLKRRSDGSKDLDWLVGELAGRFNRTRGPGYSLVDIEEYLVDATGESWSRFFQERLQRTSLLNSSDFSESDVFGSEPSSGAKELTVQSSSGRLLLLLLAVLVVFMIPVVLSAYVRRAVRLEVTMPRILPEDEDDEASGEPHGEAG